MNCFYWFLDISFARTCPEILMWDVGGQLEGKLEERRERKKELVLVKETSILDPATRATT
jgi:hypothetical protein